MMVVLNILALTIIQFMAGFGLLTLCRIRLKAPLFLSLCMIIGIAVFSLVPFFLQLFYIPLNSTTIFLSLGIICFLLNIQFNKGKQGLKKMFRGTRFRIRIYEIPFLAIISFIILAGAWRCFYFPPTPRDITSGAEVIAEYAFREHTLINSVFSVNLESTNNPFKPPFIICLQLIYKLAGVSFGQVWLSMLVISFIVFLYHAISSHIHRLLAGILILLFLAIPEMYAYTIMVLFDYSNAVYFFMGVYFLVSYLDDRRRNDLLIGGLMMGIATYIRSETIVLACLFIPLLIWPQVQIRAGIKRTAAGTFIWLLPSLLLYFLSITVYINFYLPVKYSIDENINPHLLNLGPLFLRFREMNSQLIFSESGMIRYGWFIYFFIFILVSDGIYSRGFIKPARPWLYATGVIYFGVPLLGYLVPLLDLDNSTKRALFKMFPLMLLFIANSGIMIDISEKITSWENTPMSGASA